MNQQHLKFICAALQIGSPVGVATRVYGSRGGSFMWCVNTAKMAYAVKQLAPAIDLKSERIITKYEISETIANRFSEQGIPAISAISKAGKYLLLIDGTGYLVYPWIVGHTLDRDEVSDLHAVKIAEIIAKLHRINLNIPDVKSAHFDIHANEKIIEIIDKVVSSKCVFANALKEDQSFILSVNDSYQSVIPVLKENTVITHGDLDQLNVLWKKDGEPALIDWESARRLNSTRDIVRTSISWSSAMPTESAALKIYTCMLDTYTKSGGVLNMGQMEAALLSIYGSQINWLLYNVELFLSSDAPGEKATAVKEINSVLMAMKKLENKIPNLLKLTYK